MYTKAPPVIALGRRRRTNWPYVICSLVATFGGFFLFFNGNLIPVRPSHPPLVHASGAPPLSPKSSPLLQDELLQSVHNSTLGFQEVFVVSVASRTDRRDSIALAAANSNIKVTFVDAVRGEDILNRALPPHEDGILDEIPAGAMGLWRTDANILQHIVTNNITSALIMESDADWDVRIKDQLEDFARSTRALIQPLANDPSRYADPTYPHPASAHDTAEYMYHHNLPRTTTPQVSPYGDGWDALLVGHCGIRSPVLHAPASGEWADRAAAAPKGHVFQYGDATVPEPQFLGGFNDDAVFRTLEPGVNHTRAVHHALNLVCTQAFAVSQAGARRLLHYTALRKLDAPIDCMLSAFCGDDVKVARHRGACLTTQPALFGQHRLPGSSAKNSEIDIAKGGTGDNRTGGMEIKKGATPIIRMSAQVNAMNVAYGLELEDQYPDTGSGA